MRAEEAEMDLKFTFPFPLSAVRFSQKTQWKKIKRWDQETFQKTSISKRVQLLRGRFLTLCL